MAQRIALLIVVTLAVACGSRQPEPTKAPAPKCGQVIKLGSSGC